MTSPRQEIKRRIIYFYVQTTVVVDYFGETGNIHLCFVFHWNYVLDVKIVDPGYTACLSRSSSIPKQLIVLSNAIGPAD